MIRKHARLFRPLPALVLLLLAGARLASACICERDPGLYTRLALSALVFRGTCCGVFESRASRPGESELSHAGGYRFRVNQAWWGAAPETVEVRMRANSCGMDFRPGLEYLVFCEKESGVLTTDLCSGNRPFPPEAPLGAELDRFAALPDDSTRGRALVDTLVARLMTDGRMESRIPMAGLERLTQFSDLTVPVLIRFASDSGDEEKNWRAGHALRALAAYPDRVSDFAAILSVALCDTITVRQDAALRTVEKLGERAAAVRPALETLARDGTSQAGRRARAIVRALPVEPHDSSGRWRE